MIFVGIFIFELVLLFFLSRFLTRSISVLLFRLTKSQTITIHALSFIFLPGIIIHELSHLLTAGVLFVPIGEIDFFPKITEDGVKLGSVAIGKTDIFRRMVVGIAPFIVGIALILITLFYFISPDFFLGLFTWKIALLLYIVFEITNTMFSSKKDMEGVIELLLAVVLFSAVFYFIGFRIPLSFLQTSFENNQAIEFVKKADIFLLVSITLDVLVWGLTKILVRK